MIGGLLIDAGVLAAIALFAWAGMQFGGIASLLRTVSCFIAAIIAFILRDPVGDLVEAIIGTSDDFGRVVGMLLIGAGAYVAVAKLARYWIARRALRRRDEGFDEFDVDPLDHRNVALVSGSFLGLGWAVAFVAVLVLLPADNFIARGAAASVPGRVLIEQEGGLKWITRGFPHYTQTLPKGKLGAVVGPEGALPMQGDTRSTPRPTDADILLELVNGMRTRAGVGPLGFNPEVTKVAERHASSLALEQRLSEAPLGGGALDTRVRSALGEAAPEFREDVKTLVAWAHSPGNVARGLAEHDAYGRELARGSWSEVGIGVIDTGWFNGRIYVLILIGPTSDDEAAATDAATGAATAESASGEQVDPADVDTVRSDSPAGESVSCEEPFDLDGDGIPDLDSVDPDFACPQEPGEEPLGNSSDPEALGGN